MDLKTPSPLPKCPKFSTDQHLGFCFDPLPPFGPMSQSLLFFYFEGIPNLPKLRHIFTPFLQISGAARTLFKVEEIRKSKLGGGKDLEKFELYLPVMVSKQFFYSTKLFSYFTYVILI